MLIAVTEMNTREDIDYLCEVLSEVIQCLSQPSTNFPRLGALACAFRNRCTLRTTARRPGARGFELSPNCPKWMSSAISPISRTLNYSIDTGLLPTRFVHDEIQPAGQ